MSTEMQTNKLVELKSPVTHLLNGLCNVLLLAFHKVKNACPVSSSAEDFASFKEY